MLSGLISTKFYNPLVAGHLTARPRLDARLGESLLDGCRLVLVTAPAGFGKSTLVSTWVRNQAMPYSWLSLDSSDNDPKQFLSYFLGALQKIDATIGINLVNRIQTADSGDTQAVYADVMTNLVNEIAALPGSFIVVLDDCQQLKNPTLLHLLNFLIERQPPQLHLFLLTREDLPLPVSRLRVRRQLIEIRQADLQFTPQEAEDFLCSGMGLTHLTSQDILMLDQRTEGWIAGLQLTALSLQSAPDPSRFIQSFTGSSRYILDYLLDEVFVRQPVEIQKFLLSTSILERFCAPLCDIVLKEFESQENGPFGRSQAMLELAERSNLFLIPLDNQRQWYRYHHLFADLLRHSLSKTAGEKIPLLHLRASQWFETNGFIPEAVQHAFLAEDWLYVAELVERHAWNLIIHSQVGSVAEWCSHFPEYIMAKRPSLCIFHGWALVIAFKKDNLPAANMRLEQAEACLSDIDPQAQSHLVIGAPPVPLQAWVTGQITLLRSFILMMASRKQANLQALVDLGQLAYDRLPADDVPARSAALLDICYASQARGDAEEAEKKFEKTAVIALSGGNYFGAVIAEYHRAHGLHVQGKLREVIDFCNEKKKAYGAYFHDPIKEMPAIALLDQAIGYALLEMNELDEAEAYLSGGLEVGQWMPREELTGYLALARLYAGKGDLAAMTETLRRLEMRWPDVRYCTEAMRRLNDIKSRPEDAETRAAAFKWAAEYPPEIGPDVVVPGIGPAWNDEADYAVFSAWAQIQIILGHTGAALAVLQPLLNAALDHGLVHRQIELSLLLAQAFYVQNDKEQAWKLLSDALAHAEPAGYMRLVDQGYILIRMLIEARKLGIAPQYIKRCLEIAPSMALQPSQISSAHPSLDKTTAPSNGLIEPLSSREIEVLVLMSEGLSNAQIAARLYLSPNTLKAHTQNIFGKLDVHNRVQAVNRAHELKII